MMAININENEIGDLHKKLSWYNQRGYYLNPDRSFTDALLESLLINERRYGYPACPCRLASGIKTEDLDIICPCDYRDPDLSQYETCFCGLCVSKRVFVEKRNIKPIPERRLPRAERIKLKTMAEETTKKEISNLSYPIWRCSVCGYICARDEAPETCPICGVPKERFSRFV